MNLFTVLESKAPVAPRTLFWRSVQAKRDMRAVREGDAKIVVEANHTFLYDVRRDPGERHDMARVQPDVVRRLTLKLQGWERDVDADAARRK